MCASILLPSAGEITDDAVDVGGGRHEHVDRVEAWLWLSIVRYGFDDFGLTLSKVATVATSKDSARVTFSSRMSNCLRTELRSCCECSSMTRIFHREGGLTERMASRNPRRER
jgi:hypothetical protein